MTERAEACARIRLQFIALGYAEARDWTDDEIEAASRRMSAGLATLGVSADEFARAMEQLRRAMRSPRVHADTPAVLPQNARAEQSERGDQSGSG